MTAVDRYRSDEYRRLWSAVRRSLERSGGDVTGAVSIGDPSEAERAAIIGLTGSHRRADAARVTIRLVDLDDALRRTTGLGLVSAAVAIGGPLRDRPGERDAVRAGRTAVVAELNSSPLHDRHEWYRAWVAELEAGGALTKAVNQNTIGRVLDALRVLHYLDERGAGTAAIPLPSLAEAVTFDTKSLNRGAPTATLVLNALARRFGSSQAKTAEDVRHLWESAGVVVDDLASRVLVLNLPADGAGLGEWLAGAAEHGTPFQVTLHQLGRHPIRLDAPEVFVCENPAVLRRASEELGSCSAPLICTEGRPSAAFHRVASAIRDGGGQLRYHGDFDWPGVAIARQVIERHSASPWRFGAEDYRRAVADGAERIPLAGLVQPTPWDGYLARIMKDIGYALFEESVADQLLDDLAEPRR